MKRLFFIFVALSAVLLLGMSCKKQVDTRHDDRDSETTISLEVREERPSSIYLSAKVFTTRTITEAGIVWCEKQFSDAPRLGDPNTYSGTVSNVGDHGFTYMLSGLVPGGTVSYAIVAYLKVDVNGTIKTIYSNTCIATTQQ